MRSLIRDIRGVEKFLSTDLMKAVFRTLNITQLEAAMRINELARYLAILAVVQKLQLEGHFPPPKLLDEVWLLWLQPEFRASYDWFCDDKLGYRVERRKLPDQPRNDKEFEDIAERLELELGWKYYQGESSNCSDAQAV